MATPQLNLAAVLVNAQLFSLSVLRRPLRAYQFPPFLAITQACLHPAGQELIIRFPRQSGKNETLAHAQLYLLFLLQRRDGMMLHVAPTYNPQARNALRRASSLGRNSARILSSRLHKFDNELSIGNASIAYLSGKPREHPLVSLTASIALFADEAQDIDPEYFAQAFDPMTISTDAPRIYSGTARHNETMLAIREKGATERHIITWRDVAASVPAYGRAVEREIARKGAQHPIILTEYENVAVNRIGHLFDERRRGLMSGEHPRLRVPLKGETYVATIDVGGTSLDALSENEHDATLCAVHRVVSSRDAPARFETVEYFEAWGENVLDDTPTRRALMAFLSLWKCRRIVPDATGLGIGLASALSARFGDVVRAVVLSAKTKTDMLNGMLALAETGRYKHYAGPGGGAIDANADRERLFAQLERCKHEYSGAHVSWGVPTGATWRNPLTQTDEDLHDDHLMSVSLLGLIAEDDFTPRVAVGTVREDERGNYLDHNKSWKRGA